MNDCLKYLTDRIIIISGVGRSGTTILGKVIGSMKNVFYLFEPAIMKFENNKEIFRKVLFEDYLLPLVQGRTVNFNPDDWSYIYDYKYPYEIKESYKLSRKSDALKWLENNNVSFVIKTNDVQNNFHFFKQVFPNCKFIHIIRNGYEVVESSINRGWFKDDYDYMDHLIENVNMPLYLKMKINIVDYVNRFNPETRAAIVWSELNRTAYYHKSEPNFYFLKYEDLCNNSGREINNITKKFNMELTNLSKIHIESIVNFKKEKKRIYCLNKINDSYRDVFIKENKKYGYVI